MWNARHPGGRRAGWVPMVAVARITAILGCGPTAAFAGWAEDIGYDLLKQRLGPNLPTGASVEVTQVEAPSGVDYLPQFGTNPIVGSGIFTGKVFTDMTESPEDVGTSPHAENVGRYLYSRDPAFSQAHGVAVVRAYLASHWSGSGFLDPGGREPFIDSSQVQNHSWIGAGTNDLLRRFDFAIARADSPFTACVGLDNGGGSAVPAMLAASYNAISVGRTDGIHSVGGTPVGYDGPGRTKPEIVAPFAATSYATALVSSSAAVLVDVANSSPTPDDATRPEVIKAVLLAGATKSEFPNWNRTTTRPLDSRFGAGELNIDESHAILTAGRQSHGSPEPVAPRGWDRSDASSGEARVYRFSIPEGYHAVDVSILLAWNRSITDALPGRLFEPVPSLANLDLFLRRADGGSGSGSLIDASLSTIDNVEHLHLPILAGGDYVLEVVADQPEDYALAWRSRLVSTANPGIRLDFASDLTTLTLTWDSVPGRTYAIEHTAGLLNWSTVTGAESITATSTSSSMTLPVPAGDRMFYRVVELGASN